MDSGDGFVRSAFLYFDDGESELPKYSFGTQIYKSYAEVMGFSPEFPDGSVFSFKYSGKGGEYENVSLCDVLNGSIPPQSFDDCIVLVGAYTSGMMDSYHVPVDYSHQMYGVEIHANVIQALLEHKYIFGISFWISGLVSAALTGLLAYICSKLSVIKVVVLCLSALFLKTAGGYIAFEAFGYSGDVIVFPVACLVVMAYFIAAHYYYANHIKKSIEKAFKKYVAPEIVADIAKSGSYELSLGGETRDIAVLFVDIRGFTPLSEKLPPKQVVEILNEFLKLTTGCILRHGGTLDKFIGDATMAVFNSPFDTEDYIFKAVLTAWDIVCEGEQLSQRLLEKHGIDVKLGVGVNCGSAVVGNIGCDFRMDYTVIGDTVNTAARLESKAPAGQIYISKAVYDNVKERIEADEIGEISLKGKSRGVFVYSVTNVTTKNNA